MASEAQRLIGISLTKIAQSRSHRGGVSLHKNLLVATVLQKARYIFMEEAYNMVHYQPPAPVQVRPVPQEELIGLTAEEAGLEPLAPSGDDLQESSSNDSLDFSQQTTCVRCAENQDKENHSPYQSNELTYLDLDKSSNVLRERGNFPCLKRRRAVAEWETEEAVQSILPKRSKPIEEEVIDDVFTEDAATLLSNSVSKEMHREQQKSGTNNPPPSVPNSEVSNNGMEIERITSLVSIFSFTMSEGGPNGSPNGTSKLNRSMSTPDLCSSQAKDITEMQQRPYIAMTV